MELTALINAYRGPLVAMLASWGAPWADAIELAEESFAEAWLNRESCRGDWKDSEVFGRWLRGVALNRYRNWARASWRRRLRVVSLAPEHLEEVAVAASESPNSEAPDHVDALRRAIERLPARQRQVVLMHYLEETSVREVAALLGVSAKTVEGRLYQARRALRRMLSKGLSTAPAVKALLCL